MKEWAEAGHLAVGSLPATDPLGWLVHNDVDSVVSAGYKFAAGHPAVSTVLNGTATLGHLEANVRALEIPQLTPQDSRRVVELFGEVEEYA